MLLFLLTVSPVYAISEIESRNVSRGAVQMQMVAIRSRRRALNRRMNPYVPISYFAPLGSGNYDWMEQMTISWAHFG